MSQSITASMLYDLVICDHRVTMDLYTPHNMRDAVNPFVKMLWEKGSLWEKEVIQKLQTPFLDLSASKNDEEKTRLTLEAMSQRTPLIYGGRIEDKELVGEPDLLRLNGDGYIAGDIKSGAGEEGEGDTASPKVHYAVQLGLYTDILQRKGLSGGFKAFIWDIHGNEVVYDFAEKHGIKNPRTMWQDYEECLDAAKVIVANNNATRPALSSVCKLCHWHTVCSERLNKENDLTLIPELGRSKRDVMVKSIGTVKELAEANLQTFISGGKSQFSGIGTDTLKKFQFRAQLLINPQATPVLREPVTLPANDCELFFDIEVDPMRDICYLHGFVERVKGDNNTEKFHAFFANKCAPDEEKAAFAASIKLIKEKQPCGIYYYSKYERTIYRKLRAKYPDVCSEQDIEDIFDPAKSVDLYFDVVKKATEWPTHDFSIKTLAKYLGFEWRDTHPSGAASIEWFDSWIKTGDPVIKQRILEYNEDDCRATRVLLDGIRKLA